MPTPVPDRRPFAYSCLASLAVLTLAACGGAPGTASVTAARASGDIAVSATDTTCDVATTTLGTGTHRFTITNKGSKVTEFEVLAEGGRILGEVENVAPGVVRSLLVELSAGTYQAACIPGMVGDGVRSGLTVTGSADPSADDAKLAEAVSGYATYVRDQVAVLEEQAGQFTAAVKAGDVARAQQLYPVARTSYERIEPVAESFGELDAELDARENDVEDGRPWTGFHVLEKALWTGGDLAAAGPVADELTRNVAELASRATALELQPLDLANGALGLLDEIATTKITGEEDRYSHTDLEDFSANLDGSEQAVQSLRPVIAERNPQLASVLDQRFAAVRSALDQYRQGDGYRPYTDLTPDQTRALSDSLNALAAQVSRVPAVVAQK